MVWQWEPDTQYDYGAIVEYEGHKYKIVQPHRSQADWTPPGTPALWERVPEEYHGDQQQQQSQPSYGGGGGGQGYNYGQPPQGYGDQKPSWEQHDQQQQVNIPHEEQKSSWHDLDDDRKKQLEIGGGLLAGLAAVGAGYFAYKEHGKSEEEKKANLWALQNWLKEAQARTQEFYKSGPRGPVTWVLVEGKNIPQGAIVGGEEGGRPIYICRAFHEGGIQLGKAAPNFKKGAVIGYAHDEIHLGTYELLLGDPHAVRWVDAHGRLNLSSLGARPVEGGREANGTPLFVAQAHYHNAIHPGKISEKLDGAFIPYGDTEKKISDYRVLCYA